MTATLNAPLPGGFTYMPKPTRCARCDAAGFVRRDIDGQLVCPACDPEWPHNTRAMVEADMDRIRQRTRRLTRSERDDRGIE